MANAKDLIEKLLNVFLHVLVWCWCAGRRILRGARAGDRPVLGQMGTKEAEINYVKNLKNPAHLIKKPFIALAHKHLIDIGQVFWLLPAPPASILDLGCGSGWTSEMLSQRGYEVTGVDISPDMIELARKYRRRGGGTDFITSDYETFVIGKAFDAALFFDSLHHALDETAALKCAYKALKDGGRLILLEPGVGHGTVQDSIDANRKFGVTEREMPPSKTMPILKALGFKNVRAVAALSPMLDTVEIDSAWRVLLSSQATGNQGIVIAEK